MSSKRIGPVSKLAAVGICFLALAVWLTWSGNSTAASVQRVAVQAALQVFSQPGRGPGGPFGGRPPFGGPFGGGFRDGRRDGPGSRGPGSGPPGDFRGRGPGGPGGPPPSSRPSEDFVRERLSRLEGFLRMMDANRNGMLELSEIPPERRPFFQFIAQRAGFDPSRPIPISRAIETARQRMLGQTPSGSSSDSRSRTDDRSRSSQSREKSSEKEKQQTPAVQLVPGFGPPEGVPPVPGFGPPEGTFFAYIASATNSRSSRSDSSRREEDRSRREGDRDRRESEREMRERAERIAGFIMSRYDRNRDGKLERDEWREMRGDPQEFDRNRDGVITREEILKRFEDRFRGRDSERGRSDNESQQQKQVRPRFLRPTERLPEGLPDWFRERDKNEDGQVSMAEFASEWNEQKVREYLHYDQNNDGIITPEECLAAKSSGEGEGSSSSSDDIDWGGGFGFF